MIEKERLEELIEQGKAFYWVLNKEIRMLCNLSVPTYWKKKWELYGKDCFETIEEAEWHREFGCIERTERLKLPTWEEFWNSGQTIWFTGKDGGQYGLCQYNREILLNDSYIGYLDKESYYKACRKCKEIFIGETK